MDHVQHHSASTAFALSQGSIFDALRMWKDRDWPRYDLVRSLLSQAAAAGEVSVMEAQVFAQFYELCVKPNVKGADLQEWEFWGFMKKPTRAEVVAVETAVLEIDLAGAPL